MHRAPPVTRPDMPRRYMPAAAATQQHHQASSPSERRVSADTSAAAPTTGATAAATTETFDMTDEALPADPARRRPRLQDVSNRHERPSTARLGSGDKRSSARHDDDDDDSTLPALDFSRGATFRAPHSDFQAATASWATDGSEAGDSSLPSSPTAAVRLKFSSMATFEFKPPSKDLAVAEALRGERSIHLSASSLRSPLSFLAGPVASRTARLAPAPSSRLASLHASSRLSRSLLVNPAERPLLADDAAMEDENAASEALPAFNFSYKAPFCPPPEDDVVDGESTEEPGGRAGERSPLSSAPLSSARGVLSARPLASHARALSPLTPLLHLSRRTPPDPRSWMDLACR